MVEDVGEIELIEGMLEISYCDSVRLDVGMIGAYCSVNEVINITLDSIAPKVSWVLGEVVFISTNLVATFSELDDTLRIF